MNHATEGDDLGARELLAALRNGALEVQAVADRAVKRAGRAADLNAFISVVDEVRAPSRADEAGKRLSGLPIAVKDIIDVAGFPCTGGTPALREWRPQRDAPVIRRLRDAGAVVIGKTNVPARRRGPRRTGRLAVVAVAVLAALTLVWTTRQAAFPHHKMGQPAAATPSERP